MGWKGALRSIQAAQRAAERDAKRRQRELERREKEFQKLQEYERAQHEVNLYENRLDVLTSIHKDCGSIWNWQKLKDEEPPQKPEKKASHENKVREALENFKPFMFDKIFGKVEKKVTYLRDKLEQSKELDEKEFRDELKKYEEEYKDWEETKLLADNILKGNDEAYFKAIKDINPFEGINELGSSLNFEIQDSSTIEVTFDVKGERVIPSEVKSLSISNKLLTKQMPKGQFYELYQDYVCGVVLRIARELLSLLPINTVIVNAIAEFLNTQTGHLEKQPILSILIPRETINKINFNLIDPSDSMSNFNHNMNFKRTSGFSAVEKINQ